MRELIFKFPTDKPPYFGITFDDELEAQTLNQNWVNLFKSDDWEAKIELEATKLNLTVYNTPKGLKYTYTAYKYNKHQLKKFTEEIAKVESFNFGHLIIDKAGSYKVVKTGRFKNWVLPICKLELYQEY